MRKVLITAGIIMLLFTGIPCPAQAGPGDEPIPIHTIQFTTAPDGASSLAGQIVTAQGIVTAVYRQGYVIAEPAGGPWSGIYVYDLEHRPAPGDALLLRAQVEEYHGFTELTNVQEYVLLARGQPLPPALQVPCADMAAEAYEGVLIDLGPVTISSAALGFGEWEASDGAGAARVGSRADTW